MPQFLYVAEASSFLEVHFMSGEIIQEFNDYYYRSSVWNNTRWLGVKCLKCPTDLWVYQEIIVEIKPDVIIETGTFKGGTSLFLANVCDLIGKGKVISVDVTKAIVSAHPRITYLIGDSKSKQIENQIKSLIKVGDVVMAILDSSHVREHVLEEMRIYGCLVTKGSYLIVEDTNEQGGSQALQAVKQFLDENDSFSIDESREKFFLSFNPKGWLRKC